MTFADILALDDDALRRAIDEHIYGHKDGIVIRIHVGEPMTFAAHFHTNDWTGAMTLAWHFGIDVLAPDGYSGEAWLRISGSAEPAVRCASEAEARRGICMLALWK